MTEQEVRLQARLVAIEHVLANAISTMYFTMSVTEEQILAGHAATKNSLRSETLPRVDAVQADMWTSEIEENVSRLLDAVYESWTAKLQRLKQLGL